MENKKKKTLILVLLLFAAIGIAGYGVYSYYFTQGEFGDERTDAEHDSNTIHLNGSFDPETTYYQDGENKTFLGNGNSIDLSCDEVDENFNTTCTGNLYIYNDGSTSIDVEIDDPQISSDLDISYDEPSFNWTNTTISSGNRSTLTVITNIHVNIGTENSEAQEVNSPVEPNGQVRINYKLKATQSH